jgi:uncharacterized protein
MSNHASAKSQRGTGIHYRRMFILMLFGIAHTYFLWDGDILLLYGGCGVFVYLLRKLASKWLLTIGIIGLCIPSLLFALGGAVIQIAPADFIVEFEKTWQPPPDEVAEELAAFRGNWLQQIEFRMDGGIEFYLIIFFVFGLWRIGGMMLIGMVLYRWGVFSAARSRRSYLILTVVGLGVGLLVAGYGVIQNFEAGWALEYSMFVGAQYNYWASLAVSLGYVGMVMLICKIDFLRKLTGPFAAVGRMALTNYLMQTIICTTLFYGHGLGWFGHLERIEQAGVVLAVWMFQLILSPIWLKYFRFGPFEWLWRSLSYWRLQQMRVANSG